MEHDLELIIARLEILEIEVCNILQNPGNIGKRIFLIQSYPGNIGKRIFSIFSYPGNTGNRFFRIFSYPGNTVGGRAGGGCAAPGVVLCCLGLFLGPCSWIGDM